MLIPADGTFTSALKQPVRLYGGVCVLLTVLFRVVRTHASVVLNAALKLYT